MSEKREVLGGEQHEQQLAADAIRAQQVAQDFHGITVMSEQSAYLLA